MWQKLECWQSGKTVLKAEESFLLSQIFKRTRAKRPKKGTKKHMAKSTTFSIAEFLGSANSTAQMTTSLKISARKRFSRHGRVFQVSLKKEYRSRRTFLKLPAI